MKWPVVVEEIHVMLCCALIQNRLTGVFITENMKTSVYCVMQLPIDLCHAFRVNRIPDISTL